MCVRERESGTREASQPAESAVSTLFKLTKDVKKGRKNALRESRISLCGELSSPACKVGHVCTLIPNICSKMTLTRGKLWPHAGVP